LGKSKVRLQKDLTKKLARTAAGFGFAASVFFFGYFLFEVPSNLVLHKLGTGIWIARFLVTWGTVAMLTGFAQAAPELYVVRFVLGLAEGGYVPGILYLNYWFRQQEKAETIALFMTGIPLAIILGAPISGGRRRSYRLLRRVVVPRIGGDVSLGDRCRSDSHVVGGTLAADDG
jgi:MFS family permease